MYVGAYVYVCMIVTSVLVCLYVLIRLCVYCECKYALVFVYVFMYV